MKNRRVNILWTIIMTCILTVSLCITASAATAAATSLSVGNVSGAPGAVVQVPVLLESTGDVTAAQFDLSFDQQMLTYRQTSAGDLTSAYSVSSNMIGNKLRVIIYSPTNEKIKAGSGSIANIEFQVAAGAPSGQSVLLVLSSVILADSNSTAIPSSSKDGQFKKVEGIPGSGGSTGGSNNNPTVKTSDSQNTTGSTGSNGTSGSTGSKTFVDIQKHWAQQDIEFMASKDIVKGITDNTFAPNKNITRAEFAALLVRALGINEVKPAQGQFADVEPNAWYYSSVETAAAAGLVKGLVENKYAPTNLITREQMAAMILRALAYANVNIDLTAGEQEQLLAGFRDKDKISAWGITSLAQTVKAGLINGATSTTLEPVANATRAQATVIIKRMMEKAGRL